jgi:hypothetical protein
MNSRRTIAGLILCLCLSFCILGCGGPSYVAGDSGPRYLKNNIHVQEHRHREYRAAYSNWTDPGKRHLVIPVNTEVTIGSWRRGFIIITQGTGMTIYFEYDEKRTRMSGEQYVALITSPELTRLDTFSDIDRKGIQDGKAYRGMTRDGVRVALGYPAPHATPSLQANTWIYWTNRSKTIAVEFDAQGFVSSIRKNGQDIAS